MDLPDRGLIAAHRGDVVSSGPKALARAGLPTAQGPSGRCEWHSCLSHTRSPGPPHTSGEWRATCGRGPPGGAPPPPYTRVAGLDRGTPAPGTCGARYTGLSADTWESIHHGTLHSHLVWAKLSLSSMKASWDCVSFERFTAQEAFVFSRNCQTLGVPRQSRGVTQFTYKWPFLAASPITDTTSGGGDRNQLSLFDR
jgi:hypothetical protein